MSSVRDIEPVTALKARTSALIRHVCETGSPVIITQNGRATAVLQDVESYQRQRDTLLLLKAVVQGDLDYRAGRVFTHEAARARLRSKLAEFKDGE